MALCVQSTLCYFFSGQTQIETYPKSRLHDLKGYVPLLSGTNGNRWKGGAISKKYPYVAASFQSVTIPFHRQQQRVARAL